MSFILVHDCIRNITINTKRNVHYVANDLEILHFAFYPHITPLKWKLLIFNKFNIYRLDTYYSFLFLLPWDLINEFCLLFYDVHQVFTPTPVIFIFNPFPQDNNTVFLKIDNVVNHSKRVKFLQNCFSSALTMNIPGISLPDVLPNHVDAYFQLASDIDELVDDTLTHIGCLCEYSMADIGWEVPSLKRTIIYKILLKSPNKIPFTILHEHVLGTIYLKIANIAISHTDNLCQPVNYIFDTLVYHLCWRNGVPLTVCNKPVWIQ